MLRNDNYELEAQLYTSARTSVFRAVRVADRQPVVVKTNSSEFPSARELSRLRREFSLLRRLELPGVVRAHALESWGNRLAIIQEPHEEPLSRLAQGAPVSVPAFCDLALALTGVIADVHSHVAHLDLTPANIFWKKEGALATVIGFARAVPASGGTPEPIDELSDASMPYVAPEQGGHMNRHVDQRADLYSLGAMFYELLTGAPMFAASTRKEWLYAHITRAPTPPTAPEWSIPAPVSQLVMRLLEKDPQQRYQTARVLLRDLQECRQRCSGAEQIPSFSLSRRGVEGLRTPCVLHGRSQEVQELLAAHDSVRSGATRAILVSGPTGSGKSALVGQLRSLVTQLDGYFIQGKADQFGAARPYAALAEAFLQLTTHLLSEPEEEVARWTTSLNAALAPNAQLLLEIVPELEGIIGPQPKPAPSNPVEEQNRFLSTIIAFIQCFAKPKRPFVLFLDDLQWLDTATLNLVQRVLASHDVASFLFIGAHRGEDDFLPHAESSPHKRPAAPVLRLALPPLAPDAAHLLLTDILDQGTEDTAALAALLHGAAGGNALHFIELVKWLERSRELVFDGDHGRWAWDLDRARSVAAPPELADLVLARFRSLHVQTQHGLCMASCIGPHFEAGFLAEVCRVPFEALSQRLAEALEQGFLVRVQSDTAGGSQPLREQDGLRFRHDGVQQVAHSELSETARRHAHRRIGTLMAERGSDPERAERSLEIVHHLNQAVELVATEGEQLELLHLNLVAAAKATLSAAHDSAYGLLEFAHRLLPPAAFENHFGLAFDVHYRHAAAAYLVRRFDVAELRCQEILRRSRTPLERARVYAMQLAQLTFCGRMQESIEAGLRSLAALGIRLSPRPSRLALLKDFLLAGWRLAGRSIADIEHQPLLSDERAMLCLKVLSDFIPSSYLTGNDRLFAASVLKQVSLSLRFGNGPEAASTYASFTVLLAGLGQLRRADEFGRLALRLLDRFQANDSRCRNHTLYALFAHSWTRPWSELRRWFQDAVQAGLESGDHLFTSYACGWVFQWDPNIDIETAYEEGKKYVSIIEKTEYQNARDAALLAQQLWLSLLGRTDAPCSLSDAHFDEAECDRRMRDAHYLCGLGIHALYKLELCVYYENWSDGFDIIQSSAGAIATLVGSPYMVEYCLFAFLACCSVGDGARSRRARKQARRLRNMMMRWAASTPENFGPHALLMDAEWAALSGRSADATRLFHALTAPTHRPAGARHEAIANERAALFFLAQQLPRLAAVYMSAARYHYGRWGAIAKVRFLEQRYSSLFEISASDRVLAQTTHANRGAALQRGHEVDDDACVIERACRVLAADEPLPEILSKLLLLAQESLGATRATLLLKAADGLPLQVHADIGEGVKPAALPHLLEQAQLPTRLLHHVAQGRNPVLVGDGEKHSDLNPDEYLQSARVRSALAVPIVCRSNVLGVFYVESRRASHAFNRRHTAALQLLAQQTAVMLENARLGDRLEQMSDSFARVVPRQFLTNLGRKSFTDIRLGESVRKDMTVLFSDMRGFTSIVESLGASSSIDFVNEYLFRMEAPILENGGFVDSYSGDGIMALFGGDPSHAVRAAISMLRALEELNGARSAAGRTCLQMGVGVHTGPLTLGTIGGVERFKYGVVGDTVNLAARLEGLTKLYGVPFIVSGEACSGLDAQTREDTRFLGRVRVAGRQEPVDVFEVFAAAPALEQQHKREIAPEWRRAMDSYSGRRFAEAAALFRQLRTRLEHDPPCLLFEQRAMAMLADPPGPHWTPIEILSQK